MKTRQFVRGVMLLSGAALLAAGATTAMAEDIATVRETVQFQPSQAQTDAGARKLYHRLLQAASRVCRVPGRMIEGEAYSSCASSALAQAVKDVNIDAVAAIYLEKNKAGVHEGTVTIARR